MSVGGTSNDEIKKLLQLIAGLLIGLIIFIAILVTIGFTNDAKDRLLFQTIENNTKVSNDRSTNATSERADIMLEVKETQQLIKDKDIMNVTIYNQTS